MPIARLRPRLTLFGILRRGYFPPELPPPFNTDTFARAMAQTRLTRLPSDFSQTKNEWCDFVAYSLSRPGSLRRRLAISNPLPYFRLAKFIVGNQTALLRKAGESHLSQKQNSRTLSSPAVRIYMLFRLSNPCRPFRPVALEEFFPFQESP